ncbi:MAG: hypothetical protein AAFX39_16905 [Pseudomonadota bacterium]
MTVLVRWLGFMIAGLALMMLLPAERARAQDAQLYMLDFVFLNDGYTLEDRDAFNRVSEQIAARYGIARIASLDPVAVTDGPEDIARVDIWRLPSQQAVADWNEDPDFQALQPRLGQVHDLNNLTLYFAEEILAPQIQPGTYYHLELFTFSETQFDPEGFISYVQSVDAIGIDHGIARTGSFGSITRFFGGGPDADWLNLYRVPGPEQYNAMGTDPRMVELRSTRNTLFDREGSLLGAFQAR